jgi:hypothetical protein
MDLTGSRESLQRFAGAVGAAVIGASAVTGAGLDAVTERVWELLSA